MTTAQSSQPDQLRLVRGEALRRARKAAALSAERLAEYVNDRTAGSAITKHAIYSYEQGKVLLSREVGHRIAEALQLHPGQLLLGDPDYRAPAPGSDPGSTDVPSDGPAQDDAGDAAQPGVAVQLRVQLVEASRQLLPAVRVLARLLRSSRLGRVDVSGYLDVFHLLQEDTAPLLMAPAAEAIRDFGDQAGNEHPFALLNAIEQLHRVVDETLEQLIEPKSETALSRHRICQERGQALDQLAQTLAGQISACNKRLPGVSLD